MMSKRTRQYIWWWRCKRNPLFNATGMDMDDNRYKQVYR